MKNNIQFKKISSIFEYVGWLLKNHNHQNQQQDDIYRITEVKQSSSGSCKIAVQLIGKSIQIECTPEEIVADDRMLEGFSKKDVRSITYLACAQIKKPKYKIIVQEFCETLNRILFKLRGQNNDETIVKTANQISLDKNLINGLSREDMQSISYIAGYEHSQHEEK